MKRCFVLGNGASLKEFDFSRLDGEITIGVNRIGLSGWLPSHYICTSKALSNPEMRPADFRLAIESGIPCYLDKTHKEIMGERDNIQYYERMWDKAAAQEYMWYSSPRYEKISINGTSLLAALQVAAWMNVDQIILLGVDHKWTPFEKGEADPNHFHPGYVQGDARVKNDDHARHRAEIQEEAMRIIAKPNLARARIEVLNATPGTALDTFPLVESEKVL